MGFRFSCICNMKPHPHSQKSAKHPCNGKLRDSHNAGGEVGTHAPSPDRPSSGTSHCYAAETETEGGRGRGGEGKEEGGWTKRNHKACTLTAGNDLLAKPWWGPTKWEVRCCSDLSMGPCFLTATGSPCPPATAVGAAPALMTSAAGTANAHGIAGRSPRERACTAGADNSHTAGTLRRHLERTPA